MNARRSRLRRSRLPGLDELAHRLALARLDPCVDRELDRVLARCPVCGSPDPAGIWLSLVLAPRPSGLAIYCTGGCADELVHHDLAALLEENEHAA